jgi:hypothetical protein
MRFPPCRTEPAVILAGLCEQGVTPNAQAKLDVSALSPNADDLTYSCNVDDGNNVHINPSCDVISEELCCYWLTEALCLGFGFEGLDLVTNTLVGSATCPFGFGWKWLVDVWEAAELCEAELCGGEAFTAVAVALLRGVDRLVAMAAG